MNENIDKIKYDKLGLIAILASKNLNPWYFSRELVTCKNIFLMGPGMKSKFSIRSNVVAERCISGEVIKKCVTRMISLYKRRDAMNTLCMRTRSPLTGMRA